MKNTLFVMSKRGTSVLLAALILLSSAPFITPASAHAAEVTSTIAFKNGYPTIGGNYIDCYGNVDNDAAHHTTNAADTDASHRVGQNCPPGSLVAKYLATNTQVPALAQSDRAEFTPSVNILPAVQPIVLASAPVESVSINPLAGFRFYVSPDSPAARQAREWQYSNPSGASQMKYLAAQPTAVWLGEWNANVEKDVRSLVGKAQAADSVPTFIAYAIPQRDCGGYSSGGTNNPSAYRNWIGLVASGIGSGKAVVILEPDSLAQITCLSSNDQATRLSLLSDAVSTLKKNPGTRVYIDAGHSGWIDAGTMANRLSRAGITAADGFALNVSNFVRTNDEIGYGTAVSDKTGGKHFVIDTARNGNGSNGQWCNPSGRAVGSRPTTNTGNARVDAFLWLKVPGESDGTCNGGPSAGTWWPSYAVGLVQNAGIAGL